MEEQIQTHPVNKMGPNPNEMCLWTNPVQVFVSIKSTKYVEASSWTTLVEETGELKKNMLICDDLLY